MKNIIFTDKNFQLVYSLLVKTLKQQKGVDIKNDFFELVQNSFLTNFKLNSTLLVNHKNDDKLLLEFDKVVLADCIRKISNIIDQQKNNIQKQMELQKQLHYMQKPNHIDPRIQELERIKKQSSAINHSPAIRPDGYSVMMPTLTNKNDFDSNKNYEELIKQREQPQKPFNDFYAVSNKLNANDISGYNNSTTESSVDFSSSQRNYNIKEDQAISKNDFDSMLEKQNILRNDFSRTTNDVPNEDTQNNSHLDFADINDILMSSTPTPTPTQKSHKSPKDYFLTLENSNFHLDLDFDIDTIELVDIDIIQNSNNITNNNNKFYFKETDNEEHCITIEPGFYNIDELLLLLKNKMENIGNCSYDVFKDNNTQKITISCKGLKPVKSKILKENNSGSFHFFKILFDKPDSMYHVLGFNNKLYSDDLCYKAPKKFKMFIDNTVCIYMPSINDSIISKLSINNGNNNLIINKTLALNPPVNYLDIHIKNDRNEFYDLDNEPVKIYLKITPVA